MTPRWKIPQPPIDVANRRHEGRSFWIGLLLAALAAAAVVAGILATDRISWAGGDRILSESDLVSGVTKQGAYPMSRPTGGALATSPVPTPGGGQADCPT